MLKKLKVVAIGLVTLSITACQQTTDDAEIIEAARAGYAAFQQGDMEAWAETQSSDVEWIAPKSLPYGGTYYGPQEVMDNVFAPILQLWPDFRVTDVDYKSSGNTVFITTKIFAGGAESDSIHVATIEDGKYVKFQFYDDGGFMMQSATTDEPQ
ncbi:MAG: nuclear transport factor 2 family protein [Altererythrobacter sp.]|nr:nuclear transport factor 2 family protein [Altererythrobacter sp.]